MISVIVSIAKWVIIVCTAILLLAIHWIAFLLFVAFLVFRKMSKKKKAAHTPDESHIPIRNTRIRRITVEDDEDEEYKVVGVTFDNKDGSSRQTILKKCSVGDPVELKLTTYKGKPAVEVWTDFGQIGNISSDESEDVTDAVNEGRIMGAEIGGIYGGTTDKPTIGCVIITS